MAEGFKDLTLLMILGYIARGLRWGFRRMKLSQVVLRTLAVAIVPLLWCGDAFAGLPAPELDPGTAAGGIALAAVAGILLLERYRTH
jgi:hypothetical protein